MKLGVYLLSKTPMLPIRSMLRLCFFFLLLAAGTVQAQTVFKVDGVTYKTLTGSTAQVGNDSGCAIGTGVTSINIPATVSYGGTDYVVTRIGNLAFYACMDLTSVTLPASVTSIGDIAFYYCSGLTSISLPPSLTSLGISAFSQCPGLTSITFPNSLTTISNSAFSGCTALASVTFPETLTSIGSEAFANCAMTSVTFPETLTSIDGYAFYACLNLTSVTFPKALTNLGPRVFTYCSALSEFHVPPENIGFCIIDGVLFNKDATTLICYPKGKSGSSYSIPSSVTHIDDYAFFYCSALTSITFPGSLTSIGTSAFNGCSGLTSVALPDGLTTIGDTGFCDCTGLLSLSLPGSLTNLGGSVFSRCSELTSISFAPTFTTIKNGMFSFCSKLTSLTLPASLTTIEGSGFFQCSKLASIRFLGVTQPTIASMAFANGPAGRILSIPNATTGFTASQWSASSISYHTGSFGNIKASITGPAGAQWKLLGVTGWNAPDTVLSNIGVGTYQVEFAPVAEWKTPAATPETLTAGSTVTATGTYTQDTPVSLSMMELE